MARFDVYRFSETRPPLVLDVQSNVLEPLATCVVVPLLPVDQATTEELPRLKPRLSIEGEDYVMITTDIASIPRSQLGACLTNVEATYRDEVMSAIDFLFTGF